MVEHGSVEATGVALTRGASSVYVDSAMPTSKSASAVTPPAMGPAADTSNMSLRERTIDLNAVTEAKVPIWLLGMRKDGPSLTCMICRRLNTASHAWYAKAWKLDVLKPMGTENI